MMSEETVKPTSEQEKEYSNYDLFIFALTIFSVFLLVILIIPGIDEAVKSIAFLLDTVVCVFFLGDFFRGLYRAPNRKSLPQVELDRSTGQLTGFAHLSHLQGGSVGENWTHPASPWHERSVARLQGAPRGKCAVDHNSGHLYSAVGSQRPNRRSRSAVTG